MEATVRMEMFRHSGAGGLSNVEPDVEPLRVECSPNEPACVLDK